MKKEKKTQKEKYKKVLMNLEPKLVERIDKLAKSQGTSRTFLVKSAIEKYLSENSEGEKNATS
ncbi:MAG: ribbon-helix-helix protein, CopG family [Candidatus Aenigmatarchaeota archaeon]